MNIRELYRQRRPVLSFEVFPPKKEEGGDIGVLHDALSRIAVLSPDFISVTCGAGGSGAKSGTVGIADHIQRRYGIPSLAHLTCVTSTRADIEASLTHMLERGVMNVLALRGDLPPGGQAPVSSDYHYAGELIRDLRAREKALCIGAACYPEGHIDCEDLEAGIRYLKDKEEAGANFFISQLFFENEVFFRFLERIRAAGVTLPVSAGIMPILSRAQIERMLFLCGASLPSRIIKLLHKYENNPAGLCAAGIEYAVVQARGLAEGGVDGIHVYAMNRPEIAEACAGALGRA
ncbi:MAG: methylenetetrahydrofolate reductase [Clostridiales bacterium]|nr:methylenetetrahydrofolate reductase [Clostridiales bacterium]